MRIRAISAALATIAVSTVPASASADPAETFIEQEHDRLDHMLRTPESPAREAQIHQALSGFVDYDELTRRAFGEPCPAAIPGCDDLWSGLAAAQRAEVRDLLEQLVRKNYERNLSKTLDYDVTYRGTKATGADTRVLTEAKDRQKPREPATRIDYVVMQTPGGLRVVDVITEGSSMTKSYYEQFRKKMHDPNEGYSNIVSKLREKIDKKG